MQPSLDSQIARAQALARNDDDQAAMSLANELVTRYPNEFRVWSLRAHVHERSKNYSEAITDFTRAIDIQTMQRTQDAESAVLITVDLFFNRGADRFAIGENESAIDDFTKGLALCDQHHSDDYRETLYFSRAEALLRLGKKQEALSDLAHVREDFSFWTYKLRTKSDLIADSSRMP